LSICGVFARAFAPSIRNAEKGVPVIVKNQQLVGYRARYDDGTEERYGHVGVGAEREDADVTLWREVRTG